MTLSEIRELHSMGFTPEQIIALTTPAASTPAAGNPAEDVPAPTADTTPEADNTPATGEAISPAGEAAPISATPAPENETDTTLAQLAEEVKALRQIVQGNNIRDRTFDMPETPETNPEDILALFIRPEHKTEGGT